MIIGSNLEAIPENYLFEESYASEVEFSKKTRNTTGHWLFEKRRIIFFQKDFQENIKLIRKKKEINKKNINLLD